MFDTFLRLFRKKPEPAAMPPPPRETPESLERQIAELHAEERQLQAEPDSEEKKQTLNSIERKLAVLEMERNHL
jgi:hypothetical protein